MKKQLRWKLQALFIISAQTFLLCGGTAQQKNNTATEFIANTTTVLAKTKKQNSAAEKKQKPETASVLVELFEPSAFAEKQTDTISERIRLRQQWKEALGVDIFYLYFKAKEAEVWVKNRTKTSIGNLKGRAQIKKNEIRYVFKMKF